MELDEFAAGLLSSRIGDSVVVGEKKRLAAAEKNCLGLWQKTGDLQVAVYLSISALCLYGLDGFMDALEVIKYLIDELWPDFWPGLDAGDGNDPAERINIFSMLSPHQGYYSDNPAFISRFRDTVLIEGKSYKLGDFLMASGGREISGVPFNVPLFEVEMSAVSAEFMRKELEIVFKMEDILKSLSYSVYEKTGEPVSKAVSGEVPIEAAVNFAFFSLNYFIRQTGASRRCFCAKTPDFSGAQSL